MVTGAMVLGLVIAPMGWVLMLAATVTPEWRKFPQRPGFPQDVSFSDGLWESCIKVTSMQDKVCHPVPEKMAISWPVQMVRALTVISVLAAFLSYVLTHVGARWWSEHPNYCLTGISGLLLLLSGVLYLSATTYMAYRVIATVADPQTPDVDKYHIGTCLYLGWCGGAAETFAGMCLASSFQKKNDNSLQNLPMPYNVDY